MQHEPIDLPNAYWVEPEQLLAGPYPCAVDLPTAERRVAALLSFGIDYIVDLTEPGEYNLRPYWSLLLPQADALARTVERRQPSIPDLGTPAVGQMRSILDTIDAALATGRKVYVHCWGGIGRTGTVVGCYLVRRGLRGDDALVTIAELRRKLPNGHKLSPETHAQREMVRTWRE